MRYFKTIFFYIKRHYDVLALDLVTYAVAYFVSVAIRRALDIRITHGELFLKYGLISLLIFLIMELANKNLNGVISRSFVREIKTVGLQMLATWSLYTVILYLLKNAYHFSRALYLTTFFVCFFCLLVARTIWKILAKYSRVQKRIAPKLLLVCEAPRAHRVMMRMLPGCMENQYDISGVVLNDGGPADYRGSFPHALGLEHLLDFVTDSRVQGAYVELDDPAAEAEVIAKLLDAGVIIYRSLGDSDLHYATQRLDVIGAKPVIAIEDMRVSLVTRAEKQLEKWRKRKARS